MSKEIIDNWPPVDGDYSVYNSEGDTAIVFLGDTDWELSNPSERVAISGKLVTPQGLQTIARNTITNMYIRNMIYVGSDPAPFYPLDAFKQLRKNGLQDGEIVGTKAAAPSLTEIKPQHITLFNKQITNHPHIPKQSGIEETVKNLPKTSPINHSVDIEISTRSSEVPDRSSTKNGFYVEVESITDAWNQALKTVWMQGKTLKSQYGDTKELLNLQTHIRNPHGPKQVPSNYHMDESELEEYGDNLVNPPDKTNEEYTYGHRLRQHGRYEIDQIGRVIETLNGSRDTRRATCSLWIPGKDSFKDKGQPCMVTCDFKIRDDKLHLTTVFRSHDIYGAGPSNWYGLAKLQRHVAHETNTNPGPITTLSISAHVYRKDFNKTREIINNNVNKTGFIEDKSGFFVINVNHYEEVIEIRFKDPSGVAVKNWEVESAKEGHKVVIDSEAVSLQEHAAYLAEQLVKAEQALKNNEQFIQDKA